MIEHVKGKPDSFIPGGVGAWLLHNSGQMTGECNLAKPVLSSPPTQENNDTSPPRRGGKEVGGGPVLCCLGEWCVVLNISTSCFKRGTRLHLTHCYQIHKPLSSQPQKFFSFPLTSHRNFYVYIETITIIAWTLMVRTLIQRNGLWKVLELSLRASSSPMFLEHSFLTFFF